MTLRGHIAPHLATPGASSSRTKYARARLRGNLKHAEAPRYRCQYDPFQDLGI